MTPQQIVLLLDRIINEVEGWTEGNEIRTIGCDDGDGHVDMMGLKVTTYGRNELNLAIHQALKDMGLAGQV